VPEGSGGQDPLQDVATFADTAGRGNTIPKRVGQLGFQIDNNSLWRSFSTSAGSWSPYPLDEDAFTSDSAVHPPSQQSTKAYIGAYFPPGSLVPYAGASAPAGWLLCYGQTVGRIAYAPLFAAIGTTYGPGDGSTTFNLPDLRGRTVAGRDDMGGAAASRLTNSGTGNPGINGATLGASGGVDRHTLTTAQMPSHTHSIAHVVANINAAGSAQSAFSNGSAVTTGPAGSDQAHPNVQPTLVLNYIIRI
jgi:microcystin-dependent protein